MHTTTADLLPDTETTARMAGKTQKKTVDSDAKARAMAIETGAKWKCSMVGEWVGKQDCEERYEAASDFSPCRECATVRTFLTKQAKVTEMPRQASRVEKQEPQTDPFAGLSVYSPKVSAAIGKEVYAYLGSGYLTFSMAAVVAYKLADHESATIMHDGKNGKVTRLVVYFGGKEMAVSSNGPKTKPGLSRKISSHGIIKHLKLSEYVGKRYEITEIAPGYIEVNFLKVKP